MARVGDGKCDPQREDGPVCCGVQSGSPNRAAVNLSTIEMSERAHRSCVEITSRQSWCDRFHPLTLSPERPYRNGTLVAWSECRVRGEEAMGRGSVGCRTATHDGQLG